MPETMSEKYIYGELSGSEAYPEVDIYGRLGGMVNKVLRLEREMTYMQREMADMRRKMEKMEENVSDCVECENYSRYYD